MSREILAPYNIKETNNTSQTDDVGMSYDFMKAMLKIVPYLRNSKNKHTCTISKLAELVGMSTSDFYDLLSSNLDKNPRALIGWLRLKEAEELLKNTNMSIEEIAETCNFISPNYFIASFYHRNRMTPSAYRNSRAL